MTTKIDLSANAMIEDKTPGCTNTNCCPPGAPIKRDAPKIERNDPCICGNGRQFKQCWGKNL